MIFVDVSSDFTSKCWSWIFCWSRRIYVSTVCPKPSNQCNRSV